MKTNQLYFNYPSTARIRIKKENCYYDDAQPYVYMIKTAKLCFLIPRVAVIFGKEPKHLPYIFIPNDIYKQQLNLFYSSLNTNL